MITETGQVLAVEEDGLWVETVSQSTCGACVARNGCGHHLLSKYSKKANCIKAIFLQHEPKKIWQVGDRVKIGVDEKAFVKASLLVYLFPLLCLISFASIASLVTASELFVVLAALVGLLVGGFVGGGVNNFRKEGVNALQVVVLENQHWKEVS